MPLLKVRCPSLAQQCFETGSSSSILVILLETRKAAEFLLEYVYFDQPNFSQDEILAIIDLARFAIQHILTDLLRLSMAYMLSRVLQVETVATIAPFLEQAESSDKVISGMLKNGKKVLRLFLV